MGGVFGAAYLLASIFFADRLGAAIFIGLSVTASVATSVLLDHFGLVGFKQHMASLPRVAGCVLMLAGLALVCLF